MVWWLVRCRRGGRLVSCLTYDTYFLFKPSWGETEAKPPLKKRRRLLPSDTEKPQSQTHHSPIPPNKTMHLV